ncbi:MULTISPECIES: CCA tRNA nucleotidyltransferase [Fischerella]|uniref:[cytidine(C)-cytidine(C)-adenosine (A)]-adding enzyme n=1 Tax=Fischerella muscicola CCMEE 5323 TaxID=2019572 RepID=A0A2N6JW44_FISMU|nr:MULTISPECIES: CCA tRNA nucleotidyltransferase [Fischerella]MBD2434807.1 CCA tRNA nucleotidyltransferase [Fischerella sp. FACHB-380]PLZ83959.1 [cytidine(C)-cytidine(C)-adenosine (A)]-adding enzyme [Fischerella muscicola CCMEE 5323]
MTINHLVLSTLAPENWPFSIEFLPQPAYMVGGVVRDAILGRTREYLDLDFVLPANAVTVARQIAKHYKAGFVLLDSERQIARVVFPDATADFAQQEGISLEVDLHRRDFTINAITYNPHSQEIIDPLQGCADIEKQLLRMISPQNLEDDPLRLLRAYRQACQLGFTIETDTQAAIRGLASKITRVAAERVRVELGYMLPSSQGSVWLITAGKDGLLTPFFKSATEENLQKLSLVDTAATQLTYVWPQLGEQLQNPVRDTVKTTWLGIAKLACLVNPNPEIAEIELQELTYSRAEIKAITTALKLFPQLQAPLMTLREQYFFFQEAGSVFISTAVLSVVHGQSVKAIAPLVNRYLNPNDLVAHPTPLVSGKDIMLALNIPASPLVGKLLTEIAIAQIEGKIYTATEAIELAAKLVESDESF